MDIDDVLHSVVIEPGKYEVGVHIADVDYFVEEGSALDEEAAKRATTCYLVDSRIEMLPKRLSHDLSSLHSGVDRLAFSVIWQMDEAGRVLSSPTFEKTVIRSCASLTYEEAQQRIDDAANEDEVGVWLNVRSAFHSRFSTANLCCAGVAEPSPAKTSVEAHAQSADT